MKLDDFYENIRAINLIFIVVLTTFGRYVLWASSGISCRTRECTQNMVIMVNRTGTVYPVVQIKGSVRDSV